MSDWTVSGSGTGYSAALDTVNVKEGAASIKLTTPASGNVTITKPVTWDLSANQGNFRLWVYVSGTSEPTGGSIILSSDASFSNYFITSYGGAFKLRYKPGWNLINLRTSDWKVGKGSPNWANIVRIRIRLDSRSVNTYSFDALTSGVVAQPAVIFTFDKGLSSLYSQAFSYMQSHNVRGTGYIPTNLVGNTGQVTWAQLQEMYNAGWTIGNQTMSNVDPDWLYRKLDQDGGTVWRLGCSQCQGILNAELRRLPWWEVQREYPGSHDEPGHAHRPDSADLQQRLASGEPVRDRSALDQSRAPRCPPPRAGWTRPSPARRSW